MPKVAVLRASGEPLDIVEVELIPPKEGEIQVRIRATGVCHSDLSVARGLFPIPGPTVLGHEAAGIVEVCGPGVSHFRPGDHVMVSCSPQCGACYFCRHEEPQLCSTGRDAPPFTLFDGSPRFLLNGKPVYQFVYTGTFAERTVVPAIGAVKIGRDVPFPAAALMSCAVATGFGAATNTALIERGDTVVVFGCGGVGLSSIQGARLRGAARIIAIDVFNSKLDLAPRFGATDIVNAKECDPVSKVLGMTSQRGADVSIEASGAPRAELQAVKLTRRGGQVVFVGAPSPEIRVPSLTVVELIATEKRLLGSSYGGTKLRRDVPEMVRLYQKGDLLIDELISQEIALEEINSAFKAMEAGTIAARSVIVFP